MERRIKSEPHDEESRPLHGPVKMEKGKEGTLTSLTVTDVAIERTKTEIDGDCHDYDYPKSNNVLIEIKEELHGQDCIATDEDCTIETRSGTKKSSDRPIPMTVYKVDRELVILAGSSSGQQRPDGLILDDHKYHLSSDSTSFFFSKSWKCMEKHGVAHKEENVEHFTMNRLTRSKDPYSCPCCPYASTEVKELNVHLAIHSAENACESEAIKRDNTSRKSFKCSSCHFVTAYKRSLLEHEKRIHARKKPYKCSGCAFTAAHILTLQAHERTHINGMCREKSIKCPLCTFTTGSKRQLQIHGQSYTHKKPYKCSVCSFQTADKHILQNHGRTHALKKTYLCPLCAFKADNKLLMQKHEAVHESIKCSFCPYATLYKQNMHQHNKVHVGKKIHKCIMLSNKAATATIL